jgi:hypothetical protein
MAIHRRSAGPQGGAQPGEVRRAASRVHPAHDPAEETSAFGRIGIRLILGGLFVATLALFGRTPRAVLDLPLLGLRFASTAGTLDSCRRLDAGYDAALHRLGMPEYPDVRLALLVAVSECEHEAERAWSVEQSDSCLRYARAFRDALSAREEIAYRSARTAGSEMVFGGRYSSMVRSHLDRDHDLKLAADDLLELEGKTTIPVMLQYDCLG